MELYIVLLLLLFIDNGNCSHVEKEDDLLSFNVLTMGQNAPLKCEEENTKCIMECPDRRPRPQRRILTSPLVFKLEDCDPTMRPEDENVTPTCESEYKGCYKDLRFDQYVLPTEFTISVLLNVSMNPDGKRVQIFEWGDLSMEMVSAQNGKTTLSLKDAIWITDIQLDKFNIHILILGQNKMSSSEVTGVLIDGNKTQRIGQKRIPSDKINGLNSRLIRFGYDSQEENAVNCSSFIGTITLFDVFSTKLDNGACLEEEKYIENFRRKLIYPECLCPNEHRALEGTKCEDSDRLTGKLPRTGSYFTPIEAINDGIPLNESTNLGFWLRDSDDIFVAFSDASIISRFEIIMYEQELRVAYGSSEGVLPYLTCTEGLAPGNDVEDTFNQENLVGQPYKRFTWAWDTSTAPFIARNLRLIFESNRSEIPGLPPVGNPIYEVIIHGRPFYPMITASRCSCFLGNAIDDKCTKCGQCKCRSGNWTQAGRKCEPYISHVEPRRVYLSGGTNITIYGGLLMPFSSRYKPEVTIGSNRTCNVSDFNDERIWCMVAVTDHPDYSLSAANITVYIMLRYFPYPARNSLLLEFTDDPVITSISTNEAIFGSQFSITFRGRNFADLKLINLLIAFQGSEENRWKGECKRMGNDTIICNGVIEDGDDPPGYIGRVQTDIDVVMDGLQTYRNLTAAVPKLGRFTVIKRPEIITGESLISDNRYTVFLQGKYLDNCRRYNITIGGEPCQMIDNNTTTISCFLSRHPKMENISVRVVACDFGVIYQDRIEHVTEIDASSNKVAIISSLMVSVVLILVGTVGCFIIRRKRKIEKREFEGQIDSRKTEKTECVAPKDEEPYQKLLESKSPRPEDLLCLLPEELRRTIEQNLIEDSRLNIQAEIGKGNFGKVFNGVLTATDDGDLNVAIKTLRDDEIVGTRDLVEFLEEATIMKSFHHPNVLNLLGVSIRDGRVFVVLPLMENGDLKTYISRESLSLSVNIKILCDVAHGMSYLGEQKFVHRDLAARNCMVDGLDKVLIADFGLTRDTYEKDYYRPDNQQRALPIKWMALESLITHTFSTKSDVWSFGVLMWEVLSRGVRPYTGIKNINMKAYLKQGFRLEKPAGCPDHVFQLMKSCWKKQANERPSFRFLLFELQKVLEKITSRLNSRGSASTSTTSSSSLAYSAFSSDSSSNAVKESTQSLNTETTLCAEIVSHGPEKKDLSVRYVRREESGDSPKLNAAPKSLDVNVILKSNEQRFVCKGEGGLVRNECHQNKSSQSTCDTTLDISNAPQRSLVGVCPEQIHLPLKSKSAISDTSSSSSERGLEVSRGPEFSSDWNTGESASSIHPMPLSLPTKRDRNAVEPGRSKRGLQVSQDKRKNSYSQSKSGSDNVYSLFTRKVRSKYKILHNVTGEEDYLQPQISTRDDDDDGDSSQPENRATDGDYLLFTRRSGRADHIQTTADDQEPKAGVSDDYLHFTESVRSGEKLEAVSRMGDEDYLAFTGKVMRKDDLHPTKRVTEGQPCHRSVLEANIEPSNRPMDDDYLIPTSNVEYEASRQSASGGIDTDYLEPRRIVETEDYLIPTSGGDDDDYLQPTSGVITDGDYLQPMRTIHEDNPNATLENANQRSCLEPAWDFNRSQSAIGNMPFNTGVTLSRNPFHWPLSPQSQDHKTLMKRDIVSFEQAPHPNASLASGEFCRMKQADDVMDDYELEECLSYKEDSTTDSSGSITAL